MYLSRLFPCLILTCALWQAHRDSAHGQDSSQAAWDFGYELFQLLLEENRLQVLAEWNAAWSDPPDTAIVLLGSLQDVDPSLVQRLPRFVQDGGALLLASDGPWSQAELGEIQAGPVYTGQPDDQYMGHPDCLQLTPASHAAVLSEVNSLVINRSGWFVPKPSRHIEWKGLLPLPSNCLPPDSRGQSVLSIGTTSDKSRDEPDGGLAILAADASLFTNGMLWHGDNQILAVRIADVLGDKSRTRMLFVVDGRVLDSYRERILKASGQSNPQTAQAALPEPQLSKALRLANAVVREVAASNVVNEALRQQPRNARPTSYFKAFLGILGAAALGIALWWLLTRGSVRYENPMPREMLAAYQLREAAVTRSGDYRYPAGDLAREFCYELTGSQQSNDWQQYLSECHAAESPWNKTEQQELSRIIDCACRGFHTKLNRRDFQAFARSIRKLRLSPSLDDSRTVEKLV